MKTQLTKTQIMSGLWLALLALMLAVSAARAQTTNCYYEGFETAQAQDDWSPDNGTWQIGVPTFGPATNSFGRRAFAGTNCAATVLGGNYTDNTSSRLIGPNITLPAANQNPRLRSWHWFRFNAGDFGEVQIKTATNDWQTISTVYSSTGGDVWSLVSIDLSAYAGQTVQIGFYFESHGVICCSYNDVEAGWYIDEVSVVCGPILFNNAEGFEGGWGDWSSDGGTWEVGMPTSGPGGAHSGTNCTATVLGGNYLERAGSANGASSRLISPPFVVPSATNNPRLKFWHWFAFNSGDSGQVQIKDGTNGWVTVAGAHSSAGGGVWSQAGIDLSAYAGKSVRVGFLFQASGVVCCGYNDTAAGWYIDDISLVSGPIVFNNPEGFETGIGDWSSDGGTWEVGVPTSGPGSAHTGTNCAATVLGGSYQERVGSANGASSRFISPPFVVPPAESNPRFRFQHWFLFNSGDSGQVQIKAGTNDWVTVSPVYSGSGGGVWSQPPAISLTNYAGQTVQISFWFQAKGVICCAYNDTDPGWYIDDMRLIYDFALLLGSTITRTQEVTCVSLTTFASAPAQSLSFTLAAPCGQLTNLTLDTGNRFTSANITPGTNCEWNISLQTSPTNTLFANEVVGSICFTAVSTHSAFVPLTLKNIVVTNLDNSLPVTFGFGNRAVVIANEPLLEAWLGSSQQRMLTTYGKANTAYQIRYASNLQTPLPWTLGLTNVVPVSLFYSQQLTGVLSNAPVLFLRANEN